MTAAGAGPAAVARTQARLNPAVLTLGFARRFATYKRPNLLLHDPERLMRILKHPQRPAQLILAGKAHPADQAGQALIRDWTHFIRGDANPPVVFLADYDMLMAEHMVQGIDVWINTPRRPWEACGTSGMKVLVNGGLNLSEIDGWWAEAYRPDVGWALGDGQEHGDDPAWDAAEADALYERLEQEVIPEFYARNPQGIPAAWVARMRESMATLTPRFSSGRAVIEYTEQHYLPAAGAYRALVGNQGAATRQVVDRHHAFIASWGALHFGAVAMKTDGEKRDFTAEVFRGDLDPALFRVELYANGVNGADASHEVMTRISDLAGTSPGALYGASVTSSRPATDYTARVVPCPEGLSVPLEAGQILWQR